MSVKLPKKIDYSKYNSDSGMNTKSWGPAGWNFLFISILGKYPIKVLTKEDILIKQAFKSMLTNLSIIMPCVFCRDSFKGFLEELPIEEYLIGRVELMYWLYLIKDKVNQKLIKLEYKCYNDEKRRLKTMVYNTQISESEYYKKVKEFKSDNFETIPTPPFKDVLDKYEAQRAQCDPRAKKCRLPKK